MAKYRKIKIHDLNFLVGNSTFPGLLQIAKDAEDLKDFLEAIDHFMLTAIDVEQLKAFGVNEDKIIGVYAELMDVRKQISKVKNWDYFQRILLDNSPIEIAINVANRMPELDRRDP